MNIFIRMFQLQIFFDCIILSVNFRRTIAFRFLCKTEYIGSIRNKPSNESGLGINSFVVKFAI